ncbi:Zn-ribbon domain-containing OB-fold protein [Actinomadura parmotrematis]|uniref:OB-fold domain-containing protein n=1 Tax=Actinomadura parmotrematis TaxID=2864039 RepID=A0ABS7FUF6_9ACTN|nr:OB-fold domain-containing protein [Actinomadura parmotrematis]MBW8484040.1 OB-fold domain-containing protein [Actinomadura parmotrematis]
MSATKERRPAVDGWFTAADGTARLLGTRCTSCGTPYFPRNELACRNPRCAGPKDGSELAEYAFSPRGRVWSYADARYKPPPPYVSPDPFVPYTVAAVELDEERLVVLGQVVPGVGVADLEVGMAVELTEGVLYADDEAEYTVWMWRPVG